MKEVKKDYKELKKEGKGLYSKEEKVQIKKRKGKKGYIENRKKRMIRWDRKKLKRRGKRNRG